MKNLLPWGASLIFLASPVSSVFANPVSQADRINRYSTTIPANYDRTDIYIPEDAETALPVILFLPGALVNKVYYSEFARQVASDGFVVIIPNHRRVLSEFNTAGLLSQTAQIETVLAYLEAENSDPSSPLFGNVDPDTVVLMGHSHGGAVGLTAIENTCLYPLCMQSEFTLPDAVVAGVFFGTHQQDLQTGEYRLTENEVPVALISGSQDGVATPEEITNTYTRIENPPNALITLEGVNHYGITNMNNPLGAKPDSQSPTIPQADAIAQVVKWSGLFARAYAYNDAEALEAIYCHDSSEAQDPAPGVTVLTQGSDQSFCEMVDAQ
jgi:dienelactone hydrolase